MQRFWSLYALSLFFCSNVIVCSAIEQNYSYAENQSTEYIGKPMYSADQSPDHHKYREHTAQEVGGISGFRIFNQAVELHHGGRQNTHSQHGCGRWVRCFQNAVYQNRAAIDYMKLKKHISAEYEDIKHTKNQDAAVNLQNVLSFDPLYQSKDCKPKGYKDRYDASPIGDVVEGHIDSKEIVNSLVDICVRNGRTVRANRLYINKRQ